MNYFSVMGDSISTFVGTQPEGYRVHYDYENLQKNAMRYVSDIWWAKVITHFGGRICVNNSYAGSCVAGKHPYAGNSTKRTELLHNGNIAPDIILIYMGIKDFGRGVPIKKKFPFWKNPIYFEDAYHLMLKRIEANYPTSEIICGTIARTYHAKIPNWQFPETFSGIPLEEYNDSIRFLAQKHKCEVADLSANKVYYETLDGTHPTLIGQEELARGWISCLSGIL
ncbi:MAG: hypothetical protein E7496_00615 [Ruminococcus sp.]|nr:hypothetical protein [Ruminococcus sp.]